MRRENDTAHRRTLQLPRVIETIDRLERRIGERFPDASLLGVAQDLGQLARETSAHVEWLGRPHYPLRVVSGLLIVLMIIPLVLSLVWLKFERLTTGLAFVEFLPLLEAGLGAIFFLGAIVLFLSSIENRIKRGRALRSIHELRALAHIVDMHQLTKDPERVLHPGTDTASSPKRSMTPFELGRYCDYCSEILALLAKLAAFYAQAITDPVILQAVDEIEGLTSGLSRKVWQKIMIIDRQIGESQIGDAGQS